MGKFYLRNITPKGEQGQHIPSDDCRCKPRIEGPPEERFLFHHAFDHREIWLAVERMLGMTCYEHGDFVNSDYERGAFHTHEITPKLKFEYDHEKIDPR